MSINKLESKLPEATKLMLFGSCARGSSHEESDLDITIVVKDEEMNLNTPIKRKVGRYLGNLYDRGTTAECSPLRKGEFT